MNIVLAIIFLILGLVVGSFLNVCIDRLPAKQSIVSPPSHCPECEKRLAFKDMVPVFSYISLKGRCRYCQTTIPKRILLVELCTGLGFSLLYCFYGLGIELALVLFYFCIFLIIFFIDIEHHLILNKVVYPSAVTALIISIFLPSLDFAPSVAINEHFASLGWASGIASSLLGGFVGFIIFAIIALVSRGGMGEGDIKMVGLIGLAVGYPLIFVAIILAIIIGGIVALFMIIARQKSRKQSIAFGPFLSIGAICTILWGSDILNWYLGFIQ
jgi:prepilin signal peptidase PulO-like enzyme (type II secretory pathway)